MKLRIALMALAVTLVVGVAITLFLLRFYKKRMDRIGKSEAPENPSDLSDWKHDEWTDDWKDEWNDWEIWDKKREEEK